MTWFVRLLLAAADSLPATDAPVRALVATQWRLPAAAITIEWGRLPAADRFDGAAAVRLLGSGRDGRFVVAWRNPGGREVAAVIRAGHQAQGWRASRALGAGAIVAANDVVAATELRWGPPDSASPSPVGMELRRSVAAGTFLAAPIVAPAVIIKAGDLVRFRWRRFGIAIVREATATNAARAGEVVWGRDPVRNERLRGIAQLGGYALLEESR